MAKIVLGLGASHTPMLTLDSDQWTHRAQVDYDNPRLNTSDGRWLSYAQLVEEVGEPYAEQATPDMLRERDRICEEALGRLAQALHDARPDVVVIIGDDQNELFNSANQPAIAVYHGDTVITGDKFGKPDAPGWIQQMGRGYLMDESHELPGAPALALELIEGLMEADFDVASCSHVPDPHALGFGHAYGFIVKRLFQGRTIPILPIMLNTYFPPNVPSARRCHNLGRAVRAILEASTSDARVAIVASGGLSHFIVDEQLDRKALTAMVEGDAATLQGLPREALNSGSSEILNWVATAGALEHLKVTWHEYQPIYRTPAGTGVGTAFAIWS